MSIVKNEPKYKNGLLQAIRAQLEHAISDESFQAIKRCALRLGLEER